MAAAKRSRSRARSGPAPGQRAGQLDWVPSWLPGIELRQDASGLAQLRRPLPTDSIGGWLARRLGLKRNRLYNLDEYGSFYAAQVNGTRCLRDVAELMSEHFDFPSRAAREHVVEFTQVLMLRGVLGLRPPGPAISVNPPAP